MLFLGQLKISAILQKYLTFEGFFCHNFIDKRNTKLGFLFIVVSALFNKLISIKVEELLILALNCTHSTWNDNFACPPRFMELPTALQLMTFFQMEHEAMLLHT